VKGRRGIPFVVSAPSGTGKTTVCREVVAREPDIRFSVSHTTRPPRPGEVDGRDYHFVSPHRFRELVEEGAFVEFAEYAGNVYGTSWAAIDGPLAEGVDVLLEIEVQGAAQIRERRADARFIFLLPPSRAVLEGRLRGRGSDSDDAIERRLALSRREVKAVHGFDYAVVNDELGSCVEAVLEVVRAERSGDTEAILARFGRDVTLARLRDEFEF
jgi:guanylate kinase